MRTKKNKKRNEKFFVLILSFFMLLKINMFGVESFIYIMDTGNNRVQKFNISGNYLSSFGSKGTGEAQFNYPAGICISSDMNLVYVADTANNRIQVFDKNGNFIKIFMTQALSNPNSIVVNNEQGKDFIYIADTGHNRILKYDSNGEFIYMLGKQQAGNKDGEFNNPQGITSNKDFIFISDSGNHRIQKFDLNGNFILKWGTQGKEQGKFNYPRDIAVDDKGYVYVVDSQNYRVQKFTSEGNFILEWGKRGSADGEFNNHFGIAVDTNNSIYIADAGNNRVQKFSEEGNWLKTFGTTTRSAEPGQFYYPQGVEISYLKVINTETPVLTFTPTDTITYLIYETETFTATEVFTFTSTHTQISTQVLTLTSTYTQIPTQVLTEVNTPDLELTPIESPGECEFIKVYEIKWNLSIPKCITIDKKENIYILDFLNKGILKFNKNGNFIKKIDYNLSNGRKDTPENVEYEIEILDREEETKEVNESSEEKLALLITDSSGDNLKKVEFNGKILEEVNIKIPDEKNVGNFTLGKDKKFYLANVYKGEIKIFNRQGSLLKVLKSQKKFIFTSKILADENGIIYLIDRISKKIYRIIGDTNTTEVLNFNFKNFLRYLYFIKDNYLYIVEIDKNKITIYKLICSYKTKGINDKNIKNNSGYNVLMSDKIVIISKNNEMDEKETYNYPNPCNGITTIRFITYKKQDIKIIIYNVNGKLVWQKLINSNEVRNGLNEIIFDGKNEYGVSLNNGIYFYKIITEDKMITKKLVIMK